VVEDSERYALWFAPPRYAGLARQFVSDTFGTHVEERVEPTEIELDV
jgi:hypothetical protein